jgi:hypothetical protein
MALTFGKRQTVTMMSDLPPPQMQIAERFVRIGNNYLNQVNTHAALDWSETR